jgi:hypothetical protein
LLLKKVKRTTQYEEAYQKETFPSTFITAKKKRATT